MPEPTALDTLIDNVSKLNAQELRWELTKLRAIREWALTQACDFAVGDRVVIGDSLHIGSDSGWWPYREALAPGATATVCEIDFNSHYGYWAAAVVLDREWSCGSSDVDARYWHGPADETPDGYEPPSKYDREHYPQGRKHTFHIPVRHLSLTITDKSEAAA